MNKSKIFLLIVLILAISPLKADASQYSEKFIDNLVNCRKYKEETPMNMFDSTITPTVVVKGWVNDKCVYENYAKEIPESKYTCTFTHSQLQEIRVASKKDQNSKETYKNAGMNYTSDPLSVVFTKFLNDSSTCTGPDN